METLRFRLDGFEGPLDLMLHLIQRHKLDIYDVEITRLLDQYLDFIEQMQAADLEIASEFLAMAARLVYIKTMSLLPQHEEETAELKRELEGQLLEYHLCKLVAQVLRGLLLPPDPSQRTAAGSLSRRCRQGKAEASPAPYRF